MDRHQKSKAALVDNFVPEFSTFLAGESVDLLLTPWPKRIPGFKQCRWPLKASRSRSSWVTTVRRALFERRAERKGYTPSEIQLMTAEWLACAYLKRLPKKIEHLFVDQTLLPFLWREGALRGRTYDVLLTRLPWFERQRRMRDAGIADVEVPQWLVEVEREALGQASRVITPHEDFATLFENVRRLEWAEAEVLTPARVMEKKSLLLPAPLRERHGAKAVLSAARETGMQLIVVGGDPEHLAMADDNVLFTEKGDIPWHEVAAVVHPTLFEAWPRLHLQALKLEIPVIASRGAGLEEDDIFPVPFGDDDTLFRTLSNVIARDLGPEREPQTISPDTVVRGLRPEPEAQP